MLVCTVLLHACKSSGPKSIEEYMKWLEEPEHGIVQAREVNGYKVKIKYLPYDYLAYRDMDKEHITPALKDSIERLYKNNIAFLFTIGPDEKKRNSDVMMDGISTYNDYVDRSLSMNFDMESLVSLWIDGKEYKPVLSSMENTYGLENSRSIMLVFAPGEGAAQNNIDLEFRDELFGLGILHFPFDKKNINNIPAINSWNN